MVKGLKDCFEFGPDLNGSPWPIQEAEMFLHRAL
jgi:hypothetical protein